MLYPDFQVHAKSFGYGLLSAHAMPTQKRMMEEGGRITNYNFAAEVFDIAKYGSYLAYIAGAFYMAGKSGPEWFGLLLVPVVTNILSAIYESDRPKKD